MNTINGSTTPNLFDVRIDFSSDCISPSQAYWDNLSIGGYDITITNSGYETATSSITIGSGWQEITVELDSL